MRRMTGPAAAVFAAVLLSCAYYNILWTANREYNRATGDLPYAEFWDPYEQMKLAGDKIKLVDSAANRCGKVLVLYPDSKWADDALLLMGKCFLLGQDYEKALKKFDEVNTLYSEGDLVEEARYLRAYTLVAQKFPDEAVPVLQELAETAKDKLVREKARYLGARVAFESGDCLIAIDSYVAYLEAYPGGKRNEEARLALGECLVKLGMYREAIDDLQPLLGELDEEGVLALLRVGKAHRMLGERDEAIGIFDQVLMGAGEDTLRARAGVEQALTHLDDGRYDDAIATLVLADSLGGRKLTGEINYRIALIYERELMDFDKAITHYDESVKKKSPHSRTAAERSKALKNVKKYEEDIAAGTGDIAKTRYLLAETYLYDLGMQDRALDELIAVSDSFPESEYAARSMLAVAAYLDDEGDPEASGYYERIVEGFPETPYANVARVALGLPPIDVVTKEPEPVLAPPDTSGRGAIVGPGAAPGEAPGDAAVAAAGLSPAGGDTLAVTDSTADARLGVPDIGTMPGMSDSARARYDKYMRYTRPAPPNPDSGEGDSGAPDPDIDGEEIP